MKAILIFAGVLLVMLISLPGETTAQQTMRQWSNRDRSQTIDAQFLSYDPKTRNVTLQSRSGESVVVKLTQLSSNDRRYVVKLNRNRLDDSHDEDRINTGADTALAQPRKSTTRQIGKKAFGILWTPGIEAALTEATGDETTTDDRPVMWMRVLGDLDGFM